MYKHNSHSLLGSVIAQRLNIKCERGTQAWTETPGYYPFLEPVELYLNAPPEGLYCLPRTAAVL